MHARISKALPTHPATHALALGFTNRGLPIWPVRGGAEDGGAEGGEGEGTAGKGEAGKTEDKSFTQADVDRMIAERLARAKPKDYDDLKAKASKLDEIEAASATETEKAVKAARDETEKTVRAEVQRERVLDRVEVLAAKDFADPEDARLRLEKRADEFTSKDGTVDADGIKAALATLLKDKPHLAAKGDGRPKGDASQGARKENKPDATPGVGRMRAAYAAGT